MKITGKKSLAIITAVSLLLVSQPSMVTAKSADTNNRKFTKWDYFKFSILSAILASLIFMRFTNYGIKGELTQFIISEPGAELLHAYNSKNYDNQVYKNSQSNIPFQRTSLCDEECTKRCVPDEKTGKIDIIKCLDECACNNNISNNNTPVTPTHSSFFSIFLFFVSLIAISAILYFYYIENSDGVLGENSILNYLLYKLNFRAKKSQNKQNLDIFDPEDDYEYKKLTDI